MKKIQYKLIFMCVLLCVLFLSAACTVGSKKTKDKTQETEQDDGNKNTETKALVREGTVTIKLGFSTDESDPRAKASERFKEIVEERTNGSILVEIYPDGKLGYDKELILGVINGSVDMTVSSAGNFANFAKTGISAFPFLFHNFDEAWNFMDGELVAEVNQDLLQYNIRVLAHFDNGFRCITTSESKGPINSIQDMQGLKIRTSENPIVMEMLSELGANPQSYDFTKLYDALKEGQFEGQENPIPVIYNHKLYEVQKYLAVTNHSYDGMPFVIRNDLWKILTEEEQKIISEAALEVQKLNRELNKQQTEEYVSLLEKKGMIITYPDIEEFKNATQGVYEYFIPSYGQELINKVKDAT